VKIRQICFEKNIELLEITHKQRRIVVKPAGCLCIPNYEFFTFYSHFLTADAKILHARPHLWHALSCQITFWSVNYVILVEPKTANLTEFGTFGTPTSSPYANQEAIWYLRVTLYDTFYHKTYLDRRSVSLMCLDCLGFFYFVVQSRLSLIKLTLLSTIMICSQCDCPWCWCVIVLQ